MKWLLTIGAPLCVILLALGLLAPARTELQSQTDQPAQEMPGPRDVSADEQREMSGALYKRFGIQAPGDIKPRAAGAFRFLGSKDFLYMERTDVGSVAFEATRYGTTGKELDPRQNQQSVLLRKIDAVLRQSGLDVKGRQFAQFQDEFAGAAQPKRLPANFDPRKTSTHVARTAVFQRVIDGIPFFNSEMLVGLNADGSIGRFRLHWPEVEASAIDDARKLQSSVRDGKWQMPQSLQDKDVKILEVTAGVGHSGFADPGLRARGVVRVLFRRTASGMKYPLSSTAYKYFDASGSEVVFSAFPEIPGNTLDQKYDPKK
jgi:hypothetical protein